MRVLCVGDVFGTPGLQCLEAVLPGLRKTLRTDAVIVNGENAAPEGTGITAACVRRIFSAGADVITTGNHAFRRPHYDELFEDTPMLIRPANFPHGVPGRGSCTFDLGARQLCVVNLSGQSFMGMNLHSPYDEMDAVLAREPGRFLIVDFHAESTAEKIAFARHYDGRISAVFGTHTHVQTADEAVFPGGTGFLCDAGMTGPVDGVLGARAAAAIERQRFALPVRFSPAGGRTALTGILFELDNRTGLCESVERIRTDGPQADSPRA